MCLLFTDAVSLRVDIIQKTWQLLLTVFLVFVMTLMVFPGLTSEVQNCAVKTWSPVILVFVFNLFDFIGRVSESIISTCVMQA